MENIASQLKQARVEMGMTIDEAVAKTKFTLAQINAIESGDLDFFRKDLTYFSYMIRYYANVLNYDYELLRQDVEKIVAEDEFTQEIEQIRQNVKIKTEKNKAKPTNKKKRRRNRRKIDYSFLAFLFSSIILVTILIYVGVKYVPGWFKDDPVKPPTVVEPNKPGDNETPNDIPGDQTPVDEEVPGDVDTAKIVVTASSTDPKQLEISGWEDEEEVEIKLQFKAAATWISASVNNVVLEEPLSTTYYEGDEIVVTEKASENKEVMFHLGKMLGNEFYINREKVELDESIQNNAGVVKLYFKFVKDGEQN